MAACAKRPADPANVDSVAVATEPGDPPTYVAIATGFLPDACTQIGEITQRTRGAEIEVAITTDRADADICAQVLTPFEEQIELDVAGMPAGEITVDVNGVTAQFTLAEDQ